MGTREHAKARFYKEEEAFAEDDVEKLVVEMDGEQHEDSCSIKGEELQEDEFTGLPALETLRSLSLGLLPDHYSICGERSTRLGAP